MSLDPAGVTGPEAATPDGVRIVVSGQAEPYRERSRIHRTEADKVKIWSYRPEHVQKYQAHLRLACDHAMWGRAPLAGPVLLRLTVYLPIPSSFSQRKRREAELGLVRPDKRPDLTQFLKSSEDALSTRVIGDDCQIVDQVNRKFYSSEPRLEIEVEPATPAPLLVGTGLQTTHHHRVQLTLL